MYFLSVPLLALLPSTCAALCASCTAPGPSAAADQPAWISALRAERDAVLRKINYTGGVFDTEALAWTQTAYIQPQMVRSDRGLSRARARGRRRGDMLVFMSLYLSLSLSLSLSLFPSFFL